MMQSKNAVTRALVNAALLVPIVSALYVGVLFLQRYQYPTEVWGDKAVGQSHYLRVHIAHLREKLETNPSAPELILTEPAIGYRLHTR